MGVAFAGAGPGRVVWEPVPTWPGRDVPVVTGPRESRLRGRWACAKRVGENAHRHKRKVRWLGVWGSVRETRGRTPMVKKTRVGYGCRVAGMQGENIWAMPKRKGPPFVLWFPRI